MTLYVGDYLADTRHFSADHHGAYLLLLMSMWRAGGHIPGDERSLAKLAGMSLKQWRGRGATVEALLSRDGDTVTQHRLLSELQRANDNYGKKVAAGKASAEAKALKAKQTGATGVEAVLEQTCQQNANNQNQNQNHKQRKEVVASAAPRSMSKVVSPQLPEWVSETAWNGYCEMRKRKRAPLTERAQALIFKELEQLMRQGHDPNAVLDQSTAQAWTAVYPIKEKASKTNGKQSSHDKFLAAAASLISDEFAAEPDAEGADHALVGQSLPQLLPS